MHVLFRLFMIHVGLIAACLIASFALVVAETWNLELPADVTADSAQTAGLVHTLIFAALALIVIYLPAVAFAFVTEIMRWRSILLFAAAGAILGVMPAFDVIPNWIEVVESGERLIGAPFKALPAVGILGGCAYWLIAGCRAGFRREQVDQLTA
jgi:hypothetical protein